MRWIKILVSLLLMWGVGSCIKEPTYSVVPDIKFLNLEFKKGTTDDTLTFTLKFTDGDGDLGVDGTETALGDGSIDIDDPYYFVYDTVQKKILGYIHDNNASLPKYGPNLSYVNYKAKRKIHLPAFDTLPALTCKNWQIRNSPLDTLYFQKNYNTYNFFVDVYTKNSNGTYTYFDPALYFPFGQNCVSNFFYGRFPVLSTDLGKKSPLDGTITYKVASAGLYLIFHNQTLKYRIYIMDRALHKSNVVETEYKY